MFVNEFATAKMVCTLENIFEDGEWAIMEWKKTLLDFVDADFFM